jgi:thymidylate kinase
VSKEPLDVLLAALGADVCVLHPRAPQSRLQGGDVDCALRSLDAQWPLRLPPRWRLIQCLRYDITGWQWVVENEGRVITVDTLVDPHGVGAYGFPTVLAFSADGTSLNAIRAAYLTVKRVRKGIREHSEWRRIRELARADGAGYSAALQDVFGSATAARLIEEVNRGHPPDAVLWREATGALWRRRLRSPGRVLTILVRTASRVVGRLAQPTGLYVVLAGPDGAGKSTLAGDLPEACAGPFRKSVCFHWRPGVLPRLGGLVGAPAGDPSQVHARAPHGRATSLAALAYYWTDFILGSWLKLVPQRARGGLIVLERGWWDISIDQRRYRMRVPDRLVRLCGTLVPRPDLVLVLEAPPSVLLARKREISEDEADRQSRAWRHVLPRSVRRAHLDATQS